MKYFITIILLITFLPLSVLAASQSLADQLSGRILLQVESYGRAWYVDPVGKQRYYLQDGNTAYDLMRNMSLGITNADLAKIPTNKQQRGNSKLVNRLKGRILLAVENNGEAWYVNPTDGLRHYLRDGQAAYGLMRQFALGISNENLAKIPMNKTQIAHDTCFNDVAYVKFDGTNFSHEYNADQILPLASLSKLMTAMVLLDLKPVWDKQITITKDQIDYPAIYAGDDSTSEIDLAVGDKMSFYDLWVGMLVASSNQAVAALVDSTGLSKIEFVKLMEEKAKTLGLVKTKFYDISGLDPHNVTTAKEMAKIAYQAFLTPEILEANNKRNYLISAWDINQQLKEIKVLDRNYSLQKFVPQASKTGFLVEAQRTVALKKGSKIIVVMHALSMNQRNSIIEKLLN